MSKCEQTFSQSSFSYYFCSQTNLNIFLNKTDVLGYRIKASLPCFGWNISCGIFEMLVAHRWRINWMWEPGSHKLLPPQNCGLNRSKRNIINVWTQPPLNPPQAWFSYKSALSVSLLLGRLCIDNTASHPSVVLIVIYGPFLSCTVQHCTDPSYYVQYSTVLYTIHHCTVEKCTVPSTALYCTVKHRTLPIEYCTIQCGTVIY